MKIFTFYKISFIFLILFAFNVLNIFSLRINLRKDNFFNDDPEMADSNRIPRVINIHMEDYDSDPINFRRFDGERKTYSMRVNELLEKYDNEKKALIKVITLQQSKIGHLSEIADATCRKIEPMTGRPPSKKYESIRSRYIKYK